MRLSSVTVQNYRSITRQTKFSVASLTTLVGPNNEGKSNLLKALVLAMQIIEEWPSVNSKGGKLDGQMARLFLTRGRYGSRNSGRVTYVWSDDYPLDKQSTAAPKATSLRLDFELSQDEVDLYAKRTGLPAGEILSILISLDRNSISLGVVKPGRGAAARREKSAEIAQFVSERISIVSVPAIRTVDQAVSLASDLVRIRMQSMLRSEEYLDLSNRLDALRQEVVNEVAADVTKSVARYAPSVSKISLISTPIRDSLSVSNLSVQDEVETLIDSKGDGIKSLITMSLIQELSLRRSEAHGVILAVDEPEAHLHPGSVHELQVLFQSLAEEQQVILATHNPIFVNRENVGSNILVKGNTASPAKKVDDIREILGVHVGDNLDSAEMVVFVEGITDQEILPKLLVEVNPKIRDSVHSGRLVFKPTRGVGKMRQMIQREKSTMCKIRVILDDDAAGRQEAKQVESHGVLLKREMFLLGTGARNSELEDVIDPKVYLSSLSECFGRNLVERYFKNRSKKWSDNLIHALREMGVSGEDEELIESGKQAVSEAVKRSSSDLVKADCRTRVAAAADFIIN